MNKKPVLVIMAAGMGSRYGGLKQIDKIGPSGEIIIDYSLYDAYKAGFEKAICIIKREMQEDFDNLMKNGAARKMQIECVYQDMNKIPSGFEIPEGRVKPWGTGHAILCAKDAIGDASFAIINADDYYGPTAYPQVYKFLSEIEDDELYRYCMAGYKVENTLTEAGNVARGVCESSDGEYLDKIAERTQVGQEAGKYFFIEDGVKTYIPKGTPVSMNLFGFTPSILRELEERFPVELTKILAENPLKGEFFIPKVVGALLEEKKCSVRILPSHDRWFGVTYREDREGMAAAMRKKLEEGVYPGKLWG